MTVIPDKHTFTIWQGATFFEVLTLYTTDDRTSPRDFCTSSSITGLLVNTTANSTSATLSGTASPSLESGKTYVISSASIPAANKITFTYTGSNSITLSSSTGVTTTASPGTATVTKRTLAYTAEMIIRDKPQGTALKTLSTSNGGIILPEDINSLGQIQLKISATDTASITWKSAAYDLTITGPSPDYITDALLFGGIKVNGV